MGVWPAARTSDGRLRACCVMNRWPVRMCGVRRPMVGTQVMAVQLGSSWSKIELTWTQKYRSLFVTSLQHYTALDITTPACD